MIERRPHFVVLFLLNLISISIHQAAAASDIELTSQIGHTDSVTALAVSPDGRLMLSGSADNTLKLWESASGRLIRTFTGHVATYANKRLRMAGYRDPRTGEKVTDDIFETDTGKAEITSTTFSSDGQRIISGSKDGTAKLWDVVSGRLLRSIESRTVEGYARWVTAVAFSPDGRRVLVANSDANLALHDAETGGRIHVLKGHTKYAIDAVVFSRDGRRIVSGGQDKSVKLWDAATGRMLRSFEGHAEYVKSVAITPDGKTLVSASQSTLWSGDKQNMAAVKRWDAETGRELHSHDLEAKNHLILLSHDGKYVMTSNYDGKLWDAQTGRLLHAYKRGPLEAARQYTSIAFTPDTDRVLLGNGDGAATLWHPSSGTESEVMIGRGVHVGAVSFSPDGNHLLSSGRASLWTAATGRVIRKFETDWSTQDSRYSPDGKSVLTGTDLHDTVTGDLLKRFESEGTPDATAFAPDGRSVVLGDFNRIQQWDVASGKSLRKFEVEMPKVRALAVSPDGRHVLAGGEDVDPGKLAAELWDLAAGRLVRKFKGHKHWITSVAISPDGRRAVSGSLDNSVRLWDMATGREIRAFTGHTGGVNGVAFTADGSQILSASDDQSVKIWDATSGKAIGTLRGHLDKVRSVAMSPDGQRILSGGSDGTMRIWDAVDGRNIGSLSPAGDTGWLVMTPAGFFDSGDSGQVRLHLVRGVATTTIDQVHQSLYNPDLVREALAGDPNGEVAAAAKVTNLEKVLDSGPAPTVAITSHTADNQEVSDLVTVHAKVTDSGKGVGRIEWRVNGVTAAVTAKSPGTGPEFVLAQQLALDPGENVIELVAYNAPNLLASRAAQAKITVAAPAQGVKPNLHILAVGINAYTDGGWTPPGSPGLVRFPPLSLAVKDATTIAADLKEAAGALYGQVRVTTVLDKSATRAGLDKAIEKIAADIHLRDTFILFVAGHGASENGRFYIIPADFQSGANALAESAIGQDRLQDWLANRIKARKALILLDTCESGALVAGHARSRTDTSASEAVVGRLHEATGRPVLTAAASGKPALEGLIASAGQRHGVFTWALLDALRHGDSDGNGTLELSEIAAHVQGRVPALSAELGGTGRAAIAVHAPQSPNLQSARFGSRGEDFVLTRRLP